MGNFIFRQKMCIFTVKMYISTVKMCISTVKMKFKAKERRPYKAAPTSSQRESACSVPVMYEDKAGYDMTRSQFQ